jgi:hypothetical protein
MVGRDDRIVMLSLMGAARGGSNRDHKDDALDAYLWTDDADALYGEFQRNGADLIGPPQLRIYGMKEFEVRDLDGYVICFGEEIKRRRRALCLHGDLDPPVLLAAVGIVGPPAWCSARPGGFTNRESSCRAIPCSASQRRTRSARRSDSFWLAGRYPCRRYGLDHTAALG